MLSEGEIEKAKEILYPLSIGDFITWFTTDGVIKVELAVELLLKYIEQLETDKQKLIEKLEDMKRICNVVVQSGFTDDGYIQGKEELIEEILEFLKGELTNDNTMLPR